jgi:predicted ATPase/DNA-binding SARP family transcriptional activator
MNGSGQRIYLLGEPRVSTSDSTLNVRERVIALIAYLVLHRGQMLHRDAVAFALWPDHDEGQARANLRRHVYLINNHFTADGGAPPLTGEHRTIGWNGDAGVWVDVIAFENLAERPDTAREAVELYAGDFLLRQEYEWANEARERLRNRALALLDDLADRARDEADFAAAMSYSRRLLQIDPWREDAVRKLIVLRQMTGDRAGAAQEYRTFAKALRDELGTEPMPETLALLEADAPPPRRRPVRHNIPTPLTTFLGRGTELDALATLSSANRLVTIVGFGGIGKTRIVLEFAKREAEKGARGVWFVPLSPVTDPALVLSNVMAALSLREEPGKAPDETLVGYLQPRADLIVLDACENWRDATAALCDLLLTSCEHLRIVATSRVILGCAGEARLRLAPFAESDGVSLFCDRAAAVLPSFKRTPLNAPLISHIVRRLDGIPLALELAAARTNVMSLQSLSRRLDDRFEIMSRERPATIPGQQTLQAAIDWTYGLLSEEERVLFARLSIFAGSWTLDTAEDVCSGDGLERDRIVDTLSSLLDKSLLQVDYQPEETRFYYLDTVRAHAAARLAAHGDAAQVRRKHLLWCIEFAERMAPLLFGSQQRHACAGIAREIDNVRFALESALAPDAPPDAALRLTAALGRYWFLGNIFAEGQAALTAALDSAGDGYPQLTARASVALAYLTTQRRDFEASARLAMDVLHRLREHADERTVALALMVAAICSIFGSTGIEAEVFLEELQNRVENSSDQWAPTFPQYARALAALKRGDTHRAIELLESALETVRRLDDPYDICAIGMQLGYAKLHVGEIASAASLFLECVEWFEELKNFIILGQCTEGLAFVAASMACWENAAELFGAADAMRTQSEAPHWAHWQHLRERLRDSVRAQLGGAAFDALAARGHELSLEDPYAPIRRFASQLAPAPAAAASVTA